MGIRWEAYVVLILGPGAHWDPVLLHMDINESSLLKILLELRPRPGLIAGLFERLDDVEVVLLDVGALGRAVVGVDHDVPVLELDPAAGFGAAVLYH